MSPQDIVNQIAENWVNVESYVLKFSLNHEIGLLSPVSDTLLFRADVLAHHLRLDYLHILVI